MRKKSKYWVPFQGVIVFILIFPAVLAQGDSAPNLTHGAQSRGLFEELDKDGSGGLHFAEFVKAPRLQGVEEAKRRVLFEVLDADANGLLDSQELYQGRGEKKRFPRRWKLLDSDKNGRLCFEEFLKRPRTRKDDLESKRQHFERLDADGNGELAGDELKAISFPPKTLKKGGFYLADVDGSGALSYQEFSQLELVQRLSEQLSERVFDGLDLNQDGQIQQQEFALRKGGHEMRGFFLKIKEQKALDDRRLTDQELLRAGVGASQISDLIKKHDRDANGVLDLRELPKIWKGMMQRSLREETP